MKNIAKIEDVFGERTCRTCGDSGYVCHTNYKSFVPCCPVCGVVERDELLEEYLEMLEVIEPDMGDLVVWHEEGGEREEVYRIRQEEPITPEMREWFDFDVDEESVMVPGIRDKGHVCPHCLIIWRSGCCRLEYGGWLFSSHAHFVRSWRMGDEVYYGMPKFNSRRDCVENIAQIEILEWSCSNVSNWDQIPCSWRCNFCDFGVLTNQYLPLLEDQSVVERFVREQFISQVSFIIQKPKCQLEEEMQVFDVEGDLDDVEGRMAVLRDVQNKK